MGELAALRQKRREAGGPANPLVLASSQAEMSGKLVAVADHVSKAYGAQPIVADLTTRLLRGDRLGIVGPNGAGKTTLLNLLTGKAPPDSGTVTVGTNLQVVTLDQQRAALDPAATLADTLTAGGGDTVQVGTERRHVIGYMKDFLFKPEQARTPVGVLSGGERGRLLLACAMAKPSNLMVLDEPTNDLDLETLDLLQDMIADYPGTVLLVSHDRDFLDRTVTATLAAEGAGQWTEYAGGYSDMLSQRGAAAVAEPAAVRNGARPGTNKLAAQRGGSRKMSFKDKHALETLPGDMARYPGGDRRVPGHAGGPDPVSAGCGGVRRGDGRAGQGGSEAGRGGGALAGAGAAAGGAVPRPDGQAWVLGSAQAEERQHGDDDDDESDDVDDVVHGRRLLLAGVRDPTSTQPVGSSPKRVAPLLDAVLHAVDDLRRGQADGLEAVEGQTGRLHVRHHRDAEGLGRELGVDGAEQELLEEAGGVWGGGRPA